jgi:isocitrate dehydrogenase
LEDVIIKTVEAGHMTKDLAALVGKQQAWQSTEEFMTTLATNLKARLG